MSVASSSVFFSQNPDLSAQRLLSDDKVVLGTLVIHDGRDPFTPPHSKVDWVKSSIPGIPAPRVQYQYMNSKVTLVVEGPSGDEIKKQFDDCVKEAAVAGLLAGLVTAYLTSGTGGMAASIVTFTNTLRFCIEKALKKDIDAVSAHIESQSHWDADWS